MKNGYRIRNIVLRNICIYKIGYFSLRHFLVYWREGTQYRVRNLHRPCPDSNQTNWKLWFWFWDFYLVKFMRGVVNWISSLLSNLLYFSESLSHTIATNFSLTFLQYFLYIICFIAMMVIHLKNSLDLICIICKEIILFLKLPSCGIWLAVFLSIWKDVLKEESVGD